MNIYEQAVNKFGADHQILKAVEELNELATALMHYREGKATINQVQDEIVDVSIILNQLEIILGKLPETTIAQKLTKLDKAINQ